MKNINSIVSALVMVSLLFIAGCKKDDPQPETARVQELLKANSWAIQTVTVNEVDQTSLFAGLTLSFTNTNYATTNGGVVWPASGTWEFTDETAKTIERNDGLQITINEITSTSLKLALNWTTTTLGSGRTSSVAGDHEFIFIKN
jgi:hypothetical protein